MFLAKFDGQLALSDFVVARLEEAGKTLLSLPLSGHTTRMRSGYPQIVRQIVDSYGWDISQARPPAPPPDRISRMDETLGWLALVPDGSSHLRRVLGYRMFVHPISNRHLYSWRRIGDLLGVSHTAARSWHADGVAAIAVRLAATEKYRDAALFTFQAFQNQAFPSL